MKKFLSLLFVLLTPFCFLFGCNDKRFSELPHKTGELEYEYIITKSEFPSMYTYDIEFRFSVKTSRESIEIIATYFYYDENEEKEKLLERDLLTYTHQLYGVVGYEIYRLNSSIPLNTFTKGKEISSIKLEIKK